MEKRIIVTLLSEYQILVGIDQTMKWPNVLMLLLMCLVGCAKHHSKETTVYQMQTGHPITQYRPVSSFDRVQVQGLLNVNLHTGYKSPRVELKGDVRDLAQVQVLVKDNQLVVNLGNGYPDHGAVSVDIQTQYLNSFRFNGAGTVTGNALNTNQLELYLSNQGTTRLGGRLGLEKLVVEGDGQTQLSGVISNDLEIVLKGNPKVQLGGTVGLSHLDIDGKGVLAMYWIKSNALTIRAKRAAKIYLAGIVNKLDVELFDVSMLKAKYLRANRSFVKTHDKSVAEISSVNHQSTLATDASDVYYYNLPGTRADFMAYNGSVLDMRPWSIPDAQEFKKYNKQFP